MQRLLVVTDLDGTLLDKETYDWHPAQAAIEALRDSQATFALCSSKTRAEMEVLAGEIHRETGLRGPLIAENGARGLGIAEVRQILREAAQEANCQVLGFGDMTLAQISEHTGLGTEAARLAAQREFVEPFLLLSGDAERLRQAAASRGLQFTRGGRFFHVFEKGTKGEALGSLRPGHDLCAALGDSENDRPMLDAADIAIVIPGGNLEPQAGWRVAAHKGPRGWNEEVLRLVSEIA